MANTNFIILIGGPGLFLGCDKAHDQTWLNYLVPMQLAAKRDLYNKGANEKVHWVVYEPSYKNRWKDDSVITKAEKKQDDGYNLHSIRKTAADKVKAKHAVNYLHRFKQIASSLNIKYHGISKPSEFWDYLAKMPDKSISRVWYSGHASGDGLMLSLEHDSSCGPIAKTKNMVMVSDIKTYKALSGKFISGKTSKFYGCFTSGFAQEWKRVFNVSAEGAYNKIDFGVIDKPSSIANVLTRIEQSVTSKGPAGWTKY